MLKFYEILDDFKAELNVMWDVEILNIMKCPWFSSVLFMVLHGGLGLWLCEYLYIASLVSKYFLIRRNKKNFYQIEIMKNPLLIRENTLINCNCVSSSIWLYMFMLIWS